MILKAIYDRYTNGDIKVMIVVKDKGDYITSQIFNNVWDYPSDKTFWLKRGNSDHIVNRCETSKEAVDWVDEVMEVLGVMLSKWRYAEVPANKEFRL